MTEDGTDIQTKTEGIADGVAESESRVEAQTKAGSVADGVAESESRVEAQTKAGSVAERDEIRTVFETTIETQVASTRGNSHS